MIKTTLKIDGMACSMCEAHMNDLIRKVAKVKKVASSAKAGETVVISEEELDIPLLGKEIEGIGYRSEERRVGKECRSRWSPYH